MSRQIELSTSRLKARTLPFLLVASFVWLSCRPISAGAKSEVEELLAYPLAATSDVQIAVITRHLDEINEHFFSQCSEKIVEYCKSQTDVEFRVAGRSDYDFICAHYYFMLACRASDLSGVDWDPDGKLSEQLFNNLPVDRGLIYIDVNKPDWAKGGRALVTCGSNANVISKEQPNLVWLLPYGTYRLTARAQGYPEIQQRDVELQVYHSILHESFYIEDGPGPPDPHWTMQPTRTLDSSIGPPAPAK